MSGLSTNIELKRIVAPALTSSKYGKDIKEQFENIDDNFRRVSNQDYIAGKNGANIRTIDLPIWENNDFTDLGRKLIEDLIGADNSIWDDWTVSVNSDFDDDFYSQSQYKKLSIVEWTDSSGIEHSVRFFEYIISNPFITVFYTLKDIEYPDVEENRIYVCSPQVYTFLDQRYANIEEAGGINEATFTGLEDQSCLLNLKYADSSDDSDDELEPMFVRSNLFPTLYYDDGEFKWKIYDNETGIRAEGPQGKSGERAAVFLVKVQDVSSVEEPIVDIPNLAIITHVAVLDEDYGWTWQPIDQVSVKPVQGDVSIALRQVDDVVDSSDDSELNDAFISPILIFGEEGDLSYYVTINSGNAIGNNITLNNLKNQLIQIGNGQTLGGLFIPYVAGDTTSGAHFIYADDGAGNILNIVSMIPQDGDVLDYGDVTVNQFDPSSKLNIHSGEVVIEGGSGIYNSSISTNLNGVNIVTPSRGGDIYISAGGGDLSLNSSNNTTINGNKLYLTTDSYGEISIDQSTGSGGKISIKSSSQDANITVNPSTVQIYGDDGVNVGSGDAVIISATENINISAPETTVGGSGTSTTTIKGFSTNINATDKIELNANLIFAGSQSSPNFKVRGTTASSNKTAVSARVNEVNDVYLGCPIGTVVMWMGNKEPDGWLLCNGRTIVPSNASAAADLKGVDYDNLYTALDVPYSAGGVKRLPDLQQRFPYGADPSNSVDLGSTGGTGSNKLYIENLPQAMLAVYQDTQGGTPSLSTSTSSVYKASTDIRGQSEPFTNIPPYVAINFIIKYR